MKCPNCDGDGYKMIQTYKIYCVNYYRVPDGKKYRRCSTCDGCGHVEKTENGSYVPANNSTLGCLLPIIVWAIILLVIFLN